MEIISTANTTRPENGRYLEELHVLVEQFGVYAAIRFRHVTGLNGDYDVSVLATATDCAEARKIFKEIVLHAKD